MARRVSFPLQVGIAAGIGFGGSLGFMASGLSLPDMRSLVAGSGQRLVAASKINCNIKGNVSYSGGQRIFHVPGQYYYDDTVIDSARGERWFCSEAEARAAGWRPAGY